MKFITLLLLTFIITGCSMSAESKTKIAPYTIIAENKEQKIDVRTYESMVLVSTPMTLNSERNNAFGKLFSYISGENIDQSKIPMTAPVFMDKEEPQNSENKGKKIPMTAPVFMDSDKTSDKPMMSFVMPVGYTLETTPKPKDSDVVVTEVRDYTVAVIRFNGRLTDSNTKKHKDILEQWILDNGYSITGDYQTAGYNAPYVLPVLRRNEVLIPVKKKN